jgi:hypothetical protein
MKIFFWYFITILTILLLYLLLPFFASLCIPLPYNFVSSSTFPISIACKRLYVILQLIWYMIVFQHDIFICGTAIGYRTELSWKYIPCLVLVHLIYKNNCIYICCRHFLISHSAYKCIISVPTIMHAFMKWAYVRKVMTRFPTESNGHLHIGHANIWRVQS